MESTAQANHGVVHHYSLEQAQHRLLFIVLSDAVDHLHHNTARAGLQRLQRRTLAKISQHCKRCRLDCRNSCQLLPSRGVDRSLGDCKDAVVLVEGHLLDRPHCRGATTGLYRAQLESERVPPDSTVSLC